EERRAHRRVREVAEDAAVHRAHRVRVPLLHVQRQQRLAAFDALDLEADQLGNGGRELHSSTTERITSPRRMSSNALTTSSNAMSAGPSPVCVAPKRRACSSLRSSTSIARISDAPAMRAP